mmetsp:Transcript_37091/g.68091  ORF Transcript_37091/g.68091 Transcript_37091/m.68091 type:complete len:99 (-) Transcript_37091:675-971(-)
MSTSATQANTSVKLHIDRISPNTPINLVDNQFFYFTIKTDTMPAQTHHSSTPSASSLSQFSSIRLFHCPTFSSFTVRNDLACASSATCFESLSHILFL